MTSKHRHGATLICPHCGGHETETLPGGVVAECRSCGWTFTAELAEIAMFETTPPTAAPGQQELPL